MTARATTGHTCTLTLAVLLSGTTLVAQPPEASRSPEAGEPKRGTVQANGITIAYESHGPEDREAVLLVMGIAAQLTAWPPELVDAIVARGFRVLVYDHRDTGLSTKLDAVGTPDWAGIAGAKAQGKPAPVAYTLDDMARDAVGLLDALGVKSAHVVGASMGGYIAHLIAADHPDRTLSLTSVMSDTLNPELPKPSPETMKAFPTVERYGASDPLVSAEGGKETAASIPGAELRIIPGMGHDCPLRLTDQIADAIAAAASRARKPKRG